MAATAVVAVAIMASLTLVAAHKAARSESAHFDDAVRKLVNRTATLERQALRDPPAPREPKTAGTDRKPPIKIIMVIDPAVRADRLSPYGHPRATAPFKAQLAARGTIFQYAIAASPSARPALASVMTSLFPATSGVRTARDRLDPTLATLATALGKSGFSTACFIANEATSASGLFEDFDEVHHGLIGDAPTSAVVGDALFAWLEQHRNDNAFALVHTVGATGPFDPPPPFDTWSRMMPSAQALLDPVAQRNDLDPPTVSTPTREGRRLRYDGMLRQLDQQFGRLPGMLRRLGIGDDTLIVYLSTHGTHLGEHARGSAGLWGPGPPSYAQAVRVPVIITWPKRVAAGKRVATPIHLIDIMPTVLSLAGVPIERLALQGRSLVPLLADETPAEVERELASRILFSDGGEESDPDGGWGSLYFRGWHLLESPDFETTKIFAYRGDEAERRPAHRGALLRHFARHGQDHMRAIQEGNQALGTALRSTVREDPSANHEDRALAAPQAVN